MGSTNEGRITVGWDLRGVKERKSSSIRGVKSIGRGDRNDWKVIAYEGRSSVNVVFMKWYQRGLMWVKLRVGREK